MEEMWKSLIKEEKEVKKDIDERRIGKVKNIEEDI